MASKIILSTLALFVGAGVASAAIVTPTEYAMLNGEDHYFDDSYSGRGHAQDASPLSGGLGDLTDGIVAPANWFDVENRHSPGPYVAWRSINPVITFSFAKDYVFRRVRVHMDDSNNNGGVNPPDKVVISDGTTSETFQIDDPVDDSPHWADLELGGLFGSELEITVTRRPPLPGPLNPAVDSYIMLSEFSFAADEALFGDTNADGVIDLADLNSVRNHFGEGVLLGPPVPGEAYPFNGVIDLTDVNLVRNYFGFGIPAPVPEPASLALLALGAAGIIARRRMAL